MFLIVSAVLCGIALIVAVVVFLPIDSESEETAQRLDLDGISIKHPINVYTLERSEEDLAYIQSVPPSEFDSLIGQVYQEFLTGDVKEYTQLEIDLFVHALKLDYGTGAIITVEERTALINLFEQALKKRYVLDAQVESGELAGEQIEEAYGEVQDFYKEEVQKMIQDEEIFVFLFGSTE